MHREGEESRIYSLFPIHKQCPVTSQEAGLQLQHTLPQSQSWTRLAGCSLLHSVISPSMAEILLAGQGLHPFWLKVVFTTSETFYFSALEGRNFSCSDTAILCYTFV